MNSASIDATRLVIHLGDPAGFLAAALSPRPDRTTLWHPVLADRTARPRWQVVSQQAEAGGFAGLIEAPMPDLTADRLSRSPVLASSMLLLAAALTVPVEEPLEIVWPVSVGPGFGAVGRAVEHLLLVRHLLDVNEPDHRVRIETPFLELTEVELAELAAAADVDLRDAWPCGEDRREPCTVCNGCRRWQAVLNAEATTAFAA